MEILKQWLPALIGFIGLIVPYLMYRHIKSKDDALDIKNDIEQAIEPVNRQLSDVSYNLRDAEKRLENAIKLAEERLSDSNKDTKKDFRYSLSETERRLTELVRRTEDQLKDLIDGLLTARDKRD